MTTTTCSKVFLSNFEKYLLRCSEDTLVNGKCCTLLTISEYNHYEAATIQMAFGETAYAKGGTVFECRLLDARDGGRKYLVLTDVFQIGDKVTDNLSYTARYELMYRMVNDPNFIDTQHFGNEYRLRLVDLFDAKDCAMLWSTILPNYYGIVSGIEFTREYNNQNKVLIDPAHCDKEVRDLVLTKTRFADVYMVSSNGIAKVKGSTIAFIPNKHISLELRARLKNRNAVKVTCQFNATRQKWTPVL